MKKKKITLLVSHYPDALINKRIEMLKNQYDVEVIYNERGNENFLVYKDVKYEKLKYKFGNGKLFKRIFSLIKLRKQIKQIILNNNSDYIYAFRFDMLFMVIINGFKKKKIIYEVADLHESIINNSRNIIKIIIKKVLIFIERIMCINVDILSITSKKYYDVYFSKFINKEKVVFIPNMPDLNYFKTYRKNKNEEFTIGFIGFVRYKKQMKLLIQAAEETKTKVFFAGDSEDDEIKNLSEKSKYVQYYGKYNYNNDIANLYAKCDCIYSVYDTDYNNVKFALPNKLYESIYCELPILVSEGTYLGELVNTWGVGLTVDPYSLKDLVTKIKKIKEDKTTYNTIIQNCKKNKAKINIEAYNRLFLKKITEI